MRAVHVAGLGLATPLGFEWRGLAGALSRPHDGRVPAIPASVDVGDARLHRLMSRAARLTAVAARRAVAEAGWPAPLDDVGWFAGVGFSPAPDAELEAMLRASWQAGRISPARFGEFGLRAFHPLRTFLLLPNFTMCHSALLEGTRGPNATFFSRGGGTVTALSEAVQAIAEGTCDRALAGAGDTPHDPMQQHDLARLEVGRASEGAAVLALSSRPAGPAISIPHVRLAGARRRPLAAAAALAVEGVPLPDAIVTTEPLRAFAAKTFPSATLVDATPLGELLAAGPALLWCAAIDLLASDRARVLALTTGLDAHVGAALFERAA